MNNCDANVRMFCQHFAVKSAVMVNTVNTHTILDFIKEIGFYNRI